MDRPPPVDRLADIRRRPAMYFGSTGRSGRLHLVQEVASNAFDQALVGLATEIRVTIEDDGTVEVADDGTGISTAVEPDGRSFLERVVTEFHTTPTADGHTPHVHMGVRGLGLFPVCALSEFLEVRTSDGTTTHRQSFARGRATSALDEVAGADARSQGTTVRFRPDPEMFEPGNLVLADVEKGLLTLARLIPGVALTIEARQRYGPAADLRDLHVASWPRPMPDLPELIEHAGLGGRVTVALNFVRWEAGPHVRSFCNHRETEQGGTHVQGIHQGLRRVFGGPAPKVLERLCLTVHVQLDDPQFGGPTRGHLDSPEAVALVADAIEIGLPRVFAAHEGLEAELRALVDPPEGEAS